MKNVVLLTFGSATGAGIGAEVGNLWLATPAAVVATLVCWFFSSALYDDLWEPYIQARALSKGVCPSCRTFNSLEEVTSADPETRAVKCHACGEGFLVQQGDKGVKAKSLGTKHTL